MCALRFCLSLGLTSFLFPSCMLSRVWRIRLLIALRQAPDRAVGHPEVFAHLTERHALLKQLARLMLLFWREFGLLLFGQSRRIVPLEQAQDPPIGDTQLLRDLLR